MYPTHWPAFGAGISHRPLSPTDIDRQNMFRGHLYRALAFGYQDLGPYTG